MPGVSIQTFGADFIKYLPGVIQTLKRSSDIRNLPLGNVQWEGTKLVKKLHVGYNTAIANIEDGGALRPADKQYYVESECYRKFLTGSVQVTDGILANAKTTKGSAIRVVDSELRQLLEAMRRYEGFMMWGDGTGSVGYVTATGGAANTLYVNDARGIWPNGMYEIRTSAGVLRGSFKVARGTRTPSATNEITVTTSTTLPAGITGSATGANDRVYWGYGDYSSYNRAITGFDALIDDSAAGTFQGVTIATYPWWTSAVFANAGTPRNLTSNLFRQVLATVKAESPDFNNAGGLLVATSVWDGITVEELYEHAVRITPDSKSVGITGGMTFRSSLGDITIKAYSDCPYGKMFFINRSAISRPVQRELDWRDGGMNGIFDRSDRFAGYTATALEISDLMIMERASCAKIEDLRVTPRSAY